MREAPSRAARSRSLRQRSTRAGSDGRVSAMRAEKAGVPGEFDRVARRYDLLCALNPGYGKHLAWSARRMALPARVIPKALSKNCAAFSGFFTAMAIWRSLAGIGILLSGCGQAAPRSAWLRHAAYYAGKRQAIERPRKCRHAFASSLYASSSLK